MAAHLHLAPAPASPGTGTEHASEFPIRVVLADDHPAMRRNLRLLLDADDAVEVVAEAMDLTAATAQVHAHRPNVLVLDLHLASGSVMATIRDLRLGVHATHIVVLTMETSPAFAGRALAAGASSYVLKEYADSDLLPAVRAAARGERYVSAQLAAGLSALDAAAEADRLRHGLIGA
jgi:two-component system, NarL family, response regulator NreC